MSEKTATDYEIGYKKPPKEHQFKPGVSGHPGPKKQKEDPTGSAIELFMSFKKALGRKVTVTEKGRSKKITVRQYLVDRYIQWAVKDPRGLGNLLKLIERADRADLAGLAGEPVIIQILGGLPDEED